MLSQLILNSAFAGSVYMLVALGFNLIYSTAKFFNLDLGVMAAVGGYTVYYLSKILGVNIYLSIFIGIIFAGLVGLFVDRIIYLPLRKRKASHMVLFVTSLGTMIMLQSIIAIIFSSKFKTLSHEVDASHFITIGGGVATLSQLNILIAAVLVMFGLVMLLYKSQFGKAVRAIMDDQEMSEIVGINTNRVTSYVVFISSSIAGLAGILVGFDIGIEPTMGMQLLLKGVIATIVGGIGNIYGGVLGAFLLGVAENFGVWKIPGEWKDVISFALLILFLMFRPRGIMKK